MGEVVGGNAVGLQQNVINVVLGDGQLALDQIIELELILNGAFAAEAENSGIAGIHLSLDVRMCLEVICLP
jgi:hypothetical protein